MVLVASPPYTHDSCIRSWEPKVPDQPCPQKHSQALRKAIVPFCASESLSGISPLEFLFILLDQTLKKLLFC